MVNFRKISPYTKEERSYYMKIQLKIDASVQEVEVIIQAPSYSDEITQLMERLQTKPVAVKLLMFTKKMPHTL